MTKSVFLAAVAAAGLVLVAGSTAFAKDDWRGVWKSAHTPKDKYAAQSVTITWTDTHAVADLSFDEERYTSSDIIGRGIFADGAPRTCSLVFQVGKRNRLKALGNDCPVGLRLQKAELKPVKANRKIWMSLKFIINDKGQAMTAGRTLDGTVSPDGAKPPKKALDMAGVGLGGTVAEAKAAIEGVVDDGSAVWKPELRKMNGLWRAKTVDIEVILRKLSSTVQGAQQPEEDFELWSLTDAPSDTPLLIARRWHPAEADAPMADQVSKALIKKYGKPSVDGTFSKWWYFDTNGKRVRSCKGKKFRDDIRLPWITPIELRKGCGYVLAASIRRDNNGKLFSLSTVLTDVALVLALTVPSDWPAAIDGLDKRIEAILAISQARKDEAENAPEPKL